MKKIRYIILTILTTSLVTFSGCLLEDFNPTDWAIDPELEFAQQSLTFGPEGGKQVMNLECNYFECKAQSKAEWCRVNINPVNLFINVEVDPNLTNTYRTAEVEVILEKGNKYLSKTFNVIQNAGSWQTVGSWNVLWGQNATTLQKATITAMLQNLVRVVKGSIKLGGQGLTPSDDNYFPFLSDSSEVHQVTLTSNFYINRFEVSQKEWSVIMGSNPSHFVGDSLPVENITWEEATEFVSRLSALTGLDFRIPTNAQWEYAARSRNSAPHYLYAGSNDYHDVANYVSDENSPAYTTEKIGSFKSNALGLYNMSGNVAELCSDWYGPYLILSQTDPLGPPTGTQHLTRGGSFDTQPEVNFTVYSRAGFNAEKIQTQSSFVGLRIIVMP